jgi:hypothetical protein
MHLADQTVIFPLSALGHYLGGVLCDYGVANTNRGVALSSAMLVIKYLTTHFFIAMLTLLHSQMPQPSPQAVRKQARWSTMQYPGIFAEHHELQEAGEIRRADHVAVPHADYLKGFQLCHQLGSFSLRLRFLVLREGRGGAVGVGLEDLVVDGLKIYG